MSIQTKRRPWQFSYPWPSAGPTVTLLHWDIWHGLVHANSTLSLSLHLFSTNVIFRMAGISEAHVRKQSSPFLLSSLEEEIPIHSVFLSLLHIFYKILYILFTKNVCIYKHYNILFNSYMFNQKHQNPLWNININMHTVIFTFLHCIFTITTMPVKWMCSTILTVSHLVNTAKRIIRCQNEWSFLNTCLNFAFLKHCLL